MNEASLLRELPQLWKIVGVVMYVSYEVLRQAEEKVIVLIDEKRGELLLAKIFEGGNF